MRQNLELFDLLTLGGGVVFRQEKANPFRAKEPGPPPFLRPVKPANVAQVYPGLTARSAVEGSPPPFSGCLEAMTFRLVGILFVLVVIGCGFGAQHIAYARQKNQLGRQLRQKELELREVTQAYQSMAAEQALQVAQSFAQTAPHPASVPPVQQTEFAKGNRPIESARHRTDAASFSNLHTHIADARPATHRVRIKS